MEAKELRIGNWITYPKYCGEIPIRVTGVSVVDRRDDQSGIYEEYLYILANDFLTENNFDAFIDYKGGVINPENAKPLSLTEEWLLKFGFNKDGASYFHDKISYIQIDAYVCNGNFGYCLDDERGIYLEIIYVHQIQNLYFALTGEELKLIEG